MHAEWNPKVLNVFMSSQKQFLMKLNMYSQLIFRFSIQFNCQFHLIYTVQNQNSSHLNMVYFARQRQYNKTPSEQGHGSIKIMARAGFLQKGEQHINSYKYIHYGNYFISRDLHYYLCYTRYQHPHWEVIISHNFPHPIWSLLSR